MHIVIIPSWYKDKEHPYSGIFFKDQACALAKEGANVSVLFVEGRSLRFFSLRRLIENHGQISDIYQNSFREFTLKLWNPLAQTCFGKKILVKIYLLLFKKYINKYGIPDIIQAHSAFMGGVIAKDIHNKYHIPYVVTEHSSAFLTNHRLNSYLLKELCLTKENASKYWAVSNSLIANLEKKYAMKEISLFPNFIDTSFFFPLNKSKEKLVAKDVFTFFSLGNLIEIKGYDILLEAFYASFHNNSSVRLFIGGDGPLRCQLSAKILEYKLQDQVKLLGSLTKIEIRDQFHGSDAFVLASRVETFGVAYIEAMAAGLPIIATRCGGPEDFFDDSIGYLIDKDNVIALSEALKMMVENINIFDSGYISDYVHNKYANSILAKRAIAEYDNILKEMK